MANSVCLDTYGDLESLHLAKQNKKPLLIYKKSGLNIYGPDFGYIYSYNDNLLIISNPLYNEVSINIINRDRIRSINISQKKDIFIDKYNNSQYIKRIFQKQGNILDILPNEIIDYIFELSDIIYNHPKFHMLPNYGYIELLKQIKNYKIPFVIDFCDRELACDMFSYTLKWRPTEIVVLNNFLLDEKNLIIKSYTINDNTTKIYHIEFYLPYTNIVSIKINALNIYEVNKLNMIYN